MYVTTSFFALIYPTLCFLYATCMPSTFYCVLCKYCSLPSLLYECLLDSCMFYRSLTRRNVCSPLRSYCRPNADLGPLGNPLASQNTLGCMTFLSLLLTLLFWWHVPSFDCASSRGCYLVEKRFLNSCLLTAHMSSRLFSSEAYNSIVKQTFACCKTKRLCESHFNVQWYCRS